MSYIINPAGKKIQAQLTRFISSGTYNPPANLAWIEVSATGGGGGVVGSGAETAGGGGTGFTIVNAATLGGSPVTVTVGSGSTTGNGGTSSFGAYCSGLGGQAPGLGPAPGGGATGDVQSRGGSGTETGPALLYANGGGTWITPGQHNNPSQAWGTGGGQDGTGGTAGRPGIVIIKEFVYV